jgi:hypothetical protein
VGEFKRGRVSNVPWTKPTYGIVILDEEQIGAWKTHGDHEIILNLEDGQADKIVKLAEENGVALSFLVDPESRGK